MPTWKQHCRALINKHCVNLERRTFSLSDFNTSFEDEIAGFSHETNTPFDTVRRVFQELRDEGFISFREQKGTYTLLTPAPLEYEIEEADRKFISAAPTDKVEYIREVFARDTSLIKQAKQTFGVYCQCHDCSNTFSKPDSTPYIEVHHILPLSEGGEDAISNLCVVCAHHHRMIHFGDYDSKHRLTDELLDIVAKLV